MITSQIKTNFNIKVDFKMSTLKPLLCVWLFTSWLFVCNKQEMIKCGVEQVQTILFVRP